MADRDNVEIADILGNVEKDLVGLKACNDYKPVEEFNAEEFPIENYARIAAKSVLQSAEDVMAAAESHRAACTAFADQLVKAGKEIEAHSRKVLNKIEKAAVQMKEVREAYLKEERVDECPEGGNSGNDGSRRIRRYQPE